MRWWCLAAIVVGGCSGSQSPVNGDAGALAAIGADFVSQRGCPTCHEATVDHHTTLAGNLSAVQGTLAYAANLTPDRTTGIGGWADAQIIRAFRYGVDASDAELCPTMPRFDMIGDVEASAIVAYLRSLPAVTRAIPMSMCPPVKPQPGGDMAMPPSDL
ncbi:MAG: putative diheme cytochrome c-553 [bacterium]|nr:putative diheme cytochrome c-553 [bacterium]